MTYLFTTFLYNPIYNLLIFFVSVVPGGDIGFAVIAVTLVVKFITLPLSLSMIRTQRAMKVLDPKLKELKERYKDDRMKLGEETMKLYREHKVNPFATIALIFIQLPILFALYLVFQSESLPQIDAEVLYQIVLLPEVIKTEFLGIFPMGGKTIILAILAGATQMVQARLSIPKPAPASGKSLAEDFGRAMAVQARYVIPVVIAFAAYATSGAVALYFVTSNIFGIVQELVVKRTGLRESKAAS